MKKIEIKKNSVNRKNHVLEAYTGIRQMLFHNDIVPDQKLGYRDLADRLNMSITPVVQALKFLEFQGLVRHEPNRGYYTEPIYIKEVEEIYDLRKLIEVSLLPECIKKLDEDGIYRLQTAIELHKKAIREQAFNQRLIEHRNFHLTIASISGCRVQEQILNYLFDLLYLKFGGSILFVSYMGEGDIDHQRICDAIIERDLKLSQKLLSEHISKVKKKLIAELGHLISERKLQVF